MRSNTIYSGFVRIHVLYQASIGPTYGLWLIRELEGHGYTISPGTLYPILHDMEESGLLSSDMVQAETRLRRYYKTTDVGRQMLGEVKERVRVLFGELFEE